MASASSSSSFVTHTLAYPEAPECPTAILIDERIISSLPVPRSPARLTPLGADGTTCFEVRPAGPGKGLGMFATRTIPTGSLIFVEHPAILSPAKLPLKGSARTSAYRSLSDVLPPHRREELHTMANCRSTEECPAIEEGISLTNAMAVDLDFPDEIDSEEKEYGAVFLTINRCNHSCGPNAAHKWDLASFSTSLYALRPIVAGEEITIIYTDVLQPRDTRRSHLLSDYRFTCLCPFCSLPSPLSEESDSRRVTLRDWRHTRPTFSGWATDMCRPDDFVLNSHMEALEIVEKEGLQGVKSAYVKDVCMCWALLGDENRFKTWAEELLILCEVRNPHMAQEVRAWLNDPKGQVPKWGWRMKQRLATSKKKPLENRSPSPEFYFPSTLF